MQGFFDYKSANWLGGNNLINTALLVGVGFLVYKAIKK